MEAKQSFAIEVVEKACNLTKAIQQRTHFTPYEKEDKSPVTVADYASQLLVLHFLQERFPDHVLIAEESITDLQKQESSLIKQISELLSQYVVNFSFERIVDWLEKSQRKTDQNKYWVLDPIDGTKGFLRGEQFAVALAWIEDNLPVLGVVGCPNLNLHSEPETAGPGTIAYGLKGKGSWIYPNGKFRDRVRLSVSSYSDISTAKFVSSVQSTQHANSDELMALKASLQNKTDIGYFDSQAKYVMVAAGKFDVFLRIPPKQKLDYREKIWDHAAGNLIVHEAGGMVSDIYGRPFDYSVGTSLAKNFGVVVSNGHFHQIIVDFFQNEFFGHQS